MKLTKKDFEALLNEKYGVDTQKHGPNDRAVYGARVRPYGTWMRNQDRDKFNFEYQQYLSGQHPLNAA